MNETTECPTCRRPWKSRLCTICGKTAAWAPYKHSYLKTCSPGCAKEAQRRAGAATKPRKRIEQNDQPKMTPEIAIAWLGGNCPVQAEGTINGKEFYFRARGDEWSLRIGGTDVVSAPEWRYSEDYGDDPFAAGWMTEDEARGFIAKAAGLYVND